MTKKVQLRLQTITFKEVAKNSRKIKTSEPSSKKLSLLDKIEQRIKKIKN